MSVHKINDHMALTCVCGSVNFALLRSNGIECNLCGKRQPMEWREYNATQCTECAGRGLVATDQKVDGSGFTLPGWKHCDACDGVGWTGPDALTMAEFAEIDAADARFPLE